MPPAIALPMLLLLGATFVGASALALRRRGGLSSAECLAAAWTALFWLLTAAGFALGFAGHFRVEWFLLLLAVADGALLLALRGSGAAAGRSLLRDGERWAAELDLPARAALALGTVSAAFFLLLGWRLPPVDWDGLSYHLGIALHVLQDGDFRLYPGESGYVNYFSRGSELVVALLIGCAGTIDIANAFQWLMLPPLCLCSYSMGRGVGLPRGRATVGAMLPLAVPVILYQTTVIYADLWSLGWWTVAAGAVFGARGRAEGVAPERVLWFFVAGGLAMAAKFNAAQPLALLGLVALGLWGWRALLAPRALPVAFLGFLLAAAVGLPWAVRNWVVAGSPIYPWELRIAGRVLAEGPFPFDTIRLMPEGEFANTPRATKAWRTFTAVDIESWRRAGPHIGRLHELPKKELLTPDYGYRADNKFGGWGLAWLVCGLPALLLLPFLPRGAASVPRRWTVALAVLPLGAWAVITAAWWTRFALFLPVFGGIGFLVLADRAAALGRSLGAALLGLLALTAGADWATCVLLNRDWARAARYRAESREGTAAPIDYFLWASPDSVEFRAIHRIVHSSADGDAISFHTPGVPTFTGYFTNAAGTLRLVPFPTVWPPPESMSQEHMLATLEAEHVARILLGPTSPREFQAALDWPTEELAGGFRIATRPAGS